MQYPIYPRDLRNLKRHLENCYYPFAGHVKLKGMASGDSWCKALILVKKVSKNIQETKRKVSWYLPNGWNYSFLSQGWLKEGFQRALGKAVPSWSPVHGSWTTERCWQTYFSHDWKQAFWLSFMVIHCQMVNRSGQSRWPSVFPFFSTGQPKWGGSHGRNKIIQLAFEDLL